MIWTFPKMGVPQYGWCIMENTIEMDDLGVPLFQETTMCDEGCGIFIEYCRALGGILLLVLMRVKQSNNAKTTHDREWHRYL